MVALSSPLALTMGDPAGCGPAITAAAWRVLRSGEAGAFFVIGAPPLYEGAGPIAVIEAPRDAAAAFADALPVLALDTPEAVVPGAPAPGLAAAILSSIEQAVAFARRGEAAGVVTNPISKAALYAAGFAHPGHTEYLAALCTGGGAPAPTPVMMLAGGGLRVALATIHAPLRDAVSQIRTERLVEIGGIVAGALARDFGIAAPRLAFSGLNPHAGEGGAIGREEIDIINPAAAALRKNGVDIADARPGDTVFFEALSGRFDAVIAMTHDQGLIPVKTLDFWGGVNITLGLPIIRTSPDHGVAYDAAAAGTARADSLIAAIKLAAEMATARAQAA